MWGGGGWKGGVCVKGGGGGGANIISSVGKMTNCNCDKGRFRNVSYYC